MGKLTVHQDDFFIVHRYPSNLFIPFTEVSIAIRRIFFPSIREPQFWEHDQSTINHLSPPPYSLNLHFAVRIDRRCWGKLKRDCLACHYSSIQSQSRMLYFRVRCPKIAKVTRGIPIANAKSRVSPSGSHPIQHITPPPSASQSQNS